MKIPVPLPFELQHLQTRQKTIGIRIVSNKQVKIKTLKKTKHCSDTTLWLNVNFKSISLIKFSFPSSLMHRDWCEKLQYGSAMADPLALNVGRGDGKKDGPFLA